MRLTSRREMLHWTASAALLGPAAPVELARAQQRTTRSPEGTGDSRVAVLTADSPWVIDRTVLPEPLDRALADVQRDWYKVFGHVPIVLSEVPPDGRGSLVRFALSPAEPHSEANHSPESFSLSAHWLDAGRCEWVVSGSDLRGAIYAAYRFSERILGVDPWWYWTDLEPQARSAIELPLPFHEEHGPPTFRYRGWFINDEDLLHGFSPDPLREGVYSLELLDRICETLLRLRGNVLAPATFPFPDERCQELTSRRGLILTMHHVLVTGLNTFAWPADVPFSFTKHPEIMERYWQACIEALKDKEVIWSVGYRGKGDKPFWIDEPDIDSPEARGGVITRAIAKQVQLIRAVQPQAPIIANLWSEGATLYHQGLLHIPAGVTIVWPDDGAGFIRDAGAVERHQGVYLHTMMVDIAGNHFSEFVPPERIHAQLTRFIRADATAFLLLNVGNIRSVPLSTECAMRIAWKGSSLVGLADAQYQAQFVQDWVQRQFGSQEAAAITGLLRDSFQLPAQEPFLVMPEWTGAVPQGDIAPLFRLQILAQKLIPVLREFAAGRAPGRTELTRDPAVAAYYDALFGKDYSLEALGQGQLRFAQPRARGYERLLERAKVIRSRIAARRRSFYDAYMLTPLRVQMYSNTALAQYAQGLVAVARGQLESVVRDMQAALTSCDALFAALHAAEQDRWAGWYAGDALVHLDGCRDPLRVSLAVLRHEPVPFVRSERDYPEMERYQERFRANFPLLYPHPQAR